MDQTEAILALAALAQGTRLDVFRLLVGHEPDGLPAGMIAARLCIPHNTLSSHLASLARTGLVRSRRQSRSLIYRADVDNLRLLLTFLVQDCCGGRPELCTHLAKALTPRGTTEVAHA